MIQNKAIHLLNVGFQERVCRRERLDDIAHHLQEKLKRIPDGMVVVYDSDLPRVRFGHGNVLGVGLGNSATPLVGSPVRASIDLDQSTDREVLSLPRAEGVLKSNQRSG